MEVSVKTETKQDNTNGNFGRTAALATLPVAKTKTTERGLRIETITREGRTRWMESKEPEREKEKASHCRPSVMHVAKAV